jgi:hypothetical protein
VRKTGEFTPYFKGSELGFEPFFIFFKAKIESSRRVRQVYRKEHEGNFTS